LPRRTRRLDSGSQIQKGETNAPGETLLARVNNYSLAAPLLSSLAFRAEGVVREPNHLALAGLQQLGECLILRLKYATVKVRFLRTPAHVTQSQAAERSPAVTHKITQTTESRVEGHVLGGHPMTGVRVETDERFFAVRVISWVIDPGNDAR
jgi:hypothetical protein